MAVQSDTNFAALLILAAVMAGVSLAFAVPTGVSASKRGMNPLGWGTLAFFTWIVGVVIYLICIKPRRDEVICAACGNSIPRQHVFCPFCGHKD